MSLAVSVKHGLGSFTLDAAFESRGRLTAIFGASGSGKTSLVYVIAGLVKPDYGRITVDGKTLLDTEANVFIPASKRRIGYVFQDARLFPHLTVEGNLSYGEWFTPKGQRYASRDQILSLLGIGHLLSRRPRDLSGGEKQRVAIGRALLASPQLLLMDEPLAALDQARKAEIIPYLERLRDEIRIPIVYVSHSVAEVTRLADDIAVLEHGRLAAFGPVAEIAQRLELVPPEERDEGGAVIEMAVIAYDETTGLTRLTAPSGDIYVPGHIGAPGTQARVRIRARDVMLASEEPRNISALNVLHGRVAELNPADSYSVNVKLDCGGAVIMARITRHSASVLQLEPGSRAYAVVKAVSVSGPSAR